MHTRWLMRLSLTPNQSIGLVTLFSLLVYNVGFWRNVAQQTLQHHAGNQLYLWLTLPLLAFSLWLYFRDGRMGRNKGKA